MPIGVRMPVVSMSMRPLIGIVHAFTWPGIWSAVSISEVSSSQVIGRWSGQSLRSGVCNHSGAQPEYQRGWAMRRHSLSGFSCTTVSNISIGAGSVAVSARPALPWTVSTSGNARSTRSWIWSRRVASVTETVGSVVGM